MDNHRLGLKGPRGQRHRTLWLDFYNQLISMSTVNAIVYGVVDEAFPSQVRYVGCTIRPLRERLNRHIHDNLKTPFSNWIRQIMSFGRKPVIFPIAIVNRDLKTVRERFWIDHFRQRGKLLNQRDIFSASRIPETKKKPHLIGSKNHKSKLTESEVVKIREQKPYSWREQCECASQYGVSWQTIHQIIFRKTWKSVK